ncbi:MAG: peptidoglycan DD-metalloendopeptidase family protein [Dehalococcoidia bacterium]
MKKGKLVGKIFWVALVFVTIVSMLPLGALGGHSQVQASAATIYVPDDHSTIQATVDATSLDFFPAADLPPASADANVGTLIASGVLSSSFARQLARTSDGAWYCVYHRSDGTYTQIYCSKSTDGGETWTEEQITTAPLYHYQPSVAIDSDDNVHIAWIVFPDGDPWEQSYGYLWPGYPGYPGRVSTVQYRMKTTAWQSIENVKTGYHTVLSIAVDSENNVHLVIGGHNPGAWNCEGISYTKRTASGWGPIERVSSGCWIGAAAIAIDENNNVHVVYGHAPYSEPCYEIIYRQRTSSGWGSEIQLQSLDNYGSSGISIAIDTNNCIHVVWGWQERQGNNYAIRYRKFTTFWQPIEILEGPTLYPQYSPVITIDSNSHIHVVWSGQHSGSPTYYQLRYREYTTSWQPIENLTSSTSDNQTNPSLLWANYPIVGGVKSNIPKNGYSFVWMDGTSVKYLQMAVIQLWCPWKAGDYWKAGGDGNYYGEGYHTGNSYWAVDFNKRTADDQPQKDDNEPILAAANGWITKAEWSNTRGWYVTIKHEEDQQFETLYAHLKYDPKEIPGIAVGQYVTHGTEIGRCDNTPGEPYSYGSHLHFALYKNGVSVKPSPMSGQSLNEDENGKILLSDNIRVLENWIVASLCSPGELRVYDSQGRVTGLVHGEVKNEIPNSGYYENTVTIVSPSDSYRYEVVGTGEGSYKLPVTFVREGKTDVFTATDIPTTMGAVHQYTIDWEALSKGEAGVTIKIDSDGDGEFEETIVTSQPNTPSNPSPANNATGVDINAYLSWSGGDPDVGDTVTYDFYFGTSETPPLVETIGPYPAAQSSITYDPGALSYNTTYYWQIVARDNHGVTTEGSVWNFTTGVVVVSIDAPDEVAAESEFIADVAVDYVENFDSCGFDVTYDETVITVTDVTGGEIDGHTIGVLTGDWSYVPPGPDPGKIRVAATRSGAPGPGVTGTGYIAQIHYHVLGSVCNTSNIHLENLAMYDYQAQGITTTTVDDSVHVAFPALQITTTIFPKGKVGDIYSATLEATGGKAPYNWMATGLPDGLTCSAAGVISGTPVGEVGNFNVIVTVTDALANSDSKGLTLKISCKLGDANMDGVVDTGDITKVKRIYFGLDASTPCADVNGDGLIDTGDITAIKVIYFGA